MKKHYVKIICVCIFLCVASLLGCAAQDANRQPNETAEDKTEALIAKAKAEIKKASRLMDSKSYEKAAEHCIKSIKAYPLPTAYRLLSHCYFKLKKFKMAVDASYEALEITDQMGFKAMLWIDIGIYYVWLHEFDKAIEAYRKCLELSDRTTAYSIECVNRLIESAEKLKLKHKT